MDKLRAVQESADIYVVENRLIDELPTSDGRVVDRLNEISVITRTGGWEVDFPSGAIKWTEGCNSVLGRPLDASPLSAAEYAGMVHPDDKELHRKTLARLFKKGQSIDFKYRLLVGDNCLIVRSIARAERDVNGKIVRFVGTFQDLTEVVEQATKLEETQRLLSGVLAALPDRVYVYDLKESKDIWTNRSLIETLGYRAEYSEVFGSDIHSVLIHPEDVSLRMKRDIELMKLKDGEFFRMEYRLRHADGHWITLSSRSTVFRRDENGVPSQMFGVQKDITQDRLLREMVDKSEELVRRTMEDAPLGIAVANLEGRFERVNQAFCIVVGRSAEDLIGKSLAIIDHEEELEAFVDWLIEARDVVETPPLKTEKRVKRDDGKESWVNCVTSVVRNDSQEPTHLVVQLADVTDLRQVRQKLDETSSDFRSALQGLESAIILVDAERNVKVANQAAADLLGLTLEGLLSQPLFASIWEILGPDLRPLHPTERPFARAFMGETVTGMRLAIRDTKGQVHQLKGNCTPVYKGQNSIPCAVSANFYPVSEEDAKLDEAQSRKAA